MAVRASEQRAARLAAADPAAEVAALPAVAALTAARDTPRPEPGGDDDSPGELDAGDDFYADAFEVLP
jgi:hypothetical protein